MVGGVFVHPQLQQHLGPPPYPHASEASFAPQRLNGVGRLQLFRSDGSGANSVIGIDQEISDYHSKESYSTKLRYEARASISFGDNVLAIRGMGSAAA